MKTRMRTRILALLLSMAMVMNGNITAFAGETTPSTGGDATHVHTTEECYTKVKVSEEVICGLEETEGHKHGDECYTTEEPVLICTTPESEGHKHDDSCVKIQETKTLSCEDTTEGHEHGDECYTVETEEVDNCDLEETEGHKHGEGCYKTETKQICTLEEKTAHKHDDSCYEWKEELTCTIPEVAPLAENPEETTCGTCGLALEECSCEKETTCETCGLALEECSCEKETTCETCGLALEECSCEKETTCGTCGLALEECSCKKETTCGTCGLALEECSCEKETTCKTCGLALEECSCEKITTCETCGLVLEECKCEETEKAKQQVLDVIEMIDALPTFEEINAKLDEFYKNEDEEGEIAYYTEIVVLVKTAYETYCALTDEQKADVTNADKLMSLEFIWGAAILDLEETESPTKTEYEETLEDTTTVSVELKNAEDLPDEAELVVEKITLNANEVKAIEQKAEEDGIYIRNITALDIKFEVKEGEEIKNPQPANPVKVAVTLPEIDADDNVTVYHLAESTVENMNADINDETGGVEFEAEHFSYYVFVETRDESIVEDVLNGDYAYISDIRRKEETGFITGTEPFDQDDAAGNDSNETNSILRTFDTAIYTIEYTTALRESVLAQDISGYKTGRVFFEIILPLKQDKAMFEMDGMLWLKSSQGIEYESVIVNDQQVLRGSYLLVSSEGNPAAIGASLNELTIAVRALKMTNGAKIIPQVTLWLEHNDVGVAYQDGKNIPADLVYGKNHECEEDAHGVEAKSLRLDEITISAATRYNLRLEESTSSQNSKDGTYDFDTGFENAPNRGLGKRTGRLSTVGLILEIEGKEGHGMKGVEFPTGDQEVSFKLDFRSIYYVGGNTNNPLKPSTNANYQPLFFSGDANINAGTSSNDGRTVDVYRKYALEAPYNTGKNYHACYNGGTWKFEQNSDGTITVTVKDFVINTTDGTKLTDFFPYVYSDGTESNTKYYDPKNIDNWWEVQKAVFSAGKMLLLQPYYDQDNNYIAATDTSGEGQINTTVTASEFVITEGIKTYGEVNHDDNISSEGRYLKNPGSIDGYLAYVKHGTWTYDDALTSDANNADFDWATAGQKIAIRAHTSYTKTTGDYRAAAMYQLLKWDASFFEPEGYRGGNYNYLETFPEYGDKRITNAWWAVIKNPDLRDDNGNWRSDEAMKQATIDDLEFYLNSETALADLKAENKIVVGILEERIGIQTDGSHNAMVFVDGKVKDNCDANKVYMVVRNSYAWRLLDIKQAVAAYTNETELTDADYRKYLWEKFQKIAENPLGVDMLDGNGAFKSSYISPFWRHDWWRTDGTIYRNGEVQVTNVNGCQNATKAWYDANGYHAGTGVTHYQDSCLVVPYTTTITKSTAQKESGTGNYAKSVYDMNQKQRTVDYVLKPKLERGGGQGTSAASELKTVIYITDTLPEGLKYIEGTARLGGSYTQDPSCQKAGTVTGGQTAVAENATNVGEVFTEKVTINAKGRQEITWTFPITVDVNDAVWTDSIYFSCEIGTPGNESTDVKDKDSLNNTVTIWSDKEEKRPCTLADGNMAQYGIRIAKSSAISLSKLADQLVADWAMPMGFTMNVGNNASSPQNNMCITETIPYNGIGNTTFNGKLEIIEFSAGTMTTETEARAVIDNFTFYYSTAEEYAGKTSAQLKGTDFAGNGKWTELEVAGVNTETERPELLFKVKGTNTAFPSGVSQTKQITSIVAVGSLAAEKTLKMHITFKLPTGQAGDTLTNRLSDNSLVSVAKTKIIDRTLEGLAWVDKDGDGIRLSWVDEDSDGVLDAGAELEQPLTGVKVTLLKKDPATGTYSAVASVETGKQVSVRKPNETTAYTSTENGVNDRYSSCRYKFTDLEAGTYKVKFESGTTDITDFIASPKTGGDQTLNCDTTAGYNTDKTKLLYTESDDITFLEAKKIKTGTGSVKNIDSGFYERGYEIPETGGIGTGIFTGVGSTLIATAAGLFAARKKKRDEEDCA